LPDVIDWAKGKMELSLDCFLLTFDDGLREIDDVIAPFLLRKGIPATFFISSAFLDNGELCYQHKASLLVEKIRQGISSETERQLKRMLLNMGLSFSTLSEGILKINYRQKDALDGIAEVVFCDFERYLKENQPYLTSNQVNKLIEKGFTIGAHSIDHPYYSALTLGEQLEQTIVSTKDIRKKFGLDYGAFAFPHYDTNVTPEFFQKVQESKWIDITFGTGGMLDGDSRSHRQRVNIENPMMSAREIIAWQYLRKRYKQFRKR
jgi:peptidoglycan/xylan/chitin deacetylase (PgdA/CDA1 family)